VVPTLVRNREFMLLQLGRTLSSTGTQLTQLAYPLLALAMTGSPAIAGAVGFAKLLPYPLLGLRAGALSNRWDRRTIMLTADGVRIAAIGLLGLAAAFGRPDGIVIICTAFAEGCAAVMFNAAQSGAVRAVVPRSLVPAAMNVLSTRMAIVRVVGPLVGGAAFVVDHWLPFALDALFYGVSFVALLLIRTPFPRGRTRARLGLRHLWQQPFLRTCALLFGMGNLVLPAVQLITIVEGVRQGLGGAVIGLLFAAFAAATLVGGMIAPRPRVRLSPKQILRVEACTWLGCGVFLIVPDVVVLTVAILPQALIMPASDSVVLDYRIALTPEELLGRVDGTARMIVLAGAPFSTLVAGVLLDVVAPRAALAVFTAVGLALALWHTFSPTMRNAPSLTDLECVEAR
jgi:MFS family permease